MGTFLSVFGVGVLLAGLVYVAAERYFTYNAFCQKRFFPVCTLLSLLLAICLSRVNTLIFGGFMTRQRSFLSLYPYDYTVLGFLIGAFLGAWIAAYLCHEKVLIALDILPFAFLGSLTIERIFEVFSDFGWGALVYDSRWQFFPLSTADMYGQYHLSVFFFEAAAALILFILLPKNKIGTGKSFFMGMLVFSLSQMFFESLRSETLRFGFVRIQQAECFLIVLVLTLTQIRYLGTRRGIGLAVLTLILLAVMIFCEYALDKLTEIPTLVIYLIMCLSLAATGIIIARTTHGGFEHVK